MIPRIIHQTAPSNKEEWMPVWYTCQESWKKTFRGFEYMFWTDENLKDLVTSEYPNYLYLYESYPVNICRVDIARAMILHKYGGIYADMDIYCLSDFYSELQDGISIVEACHWDENLSNSLMVSDKENHGWIELLDYAKYIFFNTDMGADLAEFTKGRDGGPFLRRDYPVGDMPGDPKIGEHRVSQYVKQLTGPGLMNYMLSKCNILPKEKFNPGFCDSTWDKTENVYTKHLLTNKWADGVTHIKHQIEKTLMNKECYASVSGEMNDFIKSIDKGWEV